MEKKPILITGSQASGSTFTGKMIALSNDVAYLHEPFNIIHRPGNFKPEFKYWFTYINKENEKDYKNSIADFINLRIRVLEEVQSCEKVRDYLRFIKYSFIKKRDKVLNKRILIKDPIAIMSAEWLANTFDMDVVVLIRGPLSFVGSLKNNQWKHPFEHFLRQPLLMDHYLNMFKDEIEFFAKEEQTIVDQAILLWNIIYSVVLEYYEKYKNKWLFLKHEDLSADPIITFKMMYERLGLNINPHIEQQIYKYTHSKQSNSIYKRNSKQIIFNWKKRLTEEEIKKVLKKTQNVRLKLYSKNEFI